MAYEENHKPTISNPFKPTAGRMPPALIGRDSVIEDFNEGLDDGPGAPGRLMRVTGARGVDETVILTEFGRIAKARSWEVIDETASAGLTKRLLDGLSTPSHGVGITAKPTLQIPALGTVSLGEADISAQTMPMTPRNAMSRRLDKLERKHVGLIDHHR